MKRIVFALGMVTALAFALGVAGPTSAFAQTQEIGEEERLEELQAIIAQLLSLIAELQKQLVVLLQTSPLEARFPTGCGQAEIAWDKVSGAKSYVLERNGIEVYSGKDQKFIDTGLAPGAQYAYTVRAENAGGLGPASPVQTIAISSQCPPAVPVVWAQEGVCGGQAQVSWSQARGARFYEVFRGKTRVFGGSITSFVDRDLKPGKTYSYKVRAGNVGGWGGFSQETEVKASPVCPPEAPKAPAVGTPFLEEFGAQEGRLVFTMHKKPSGATAQSGKGGVTIVSFRAEAEHSPIVIDRLDVAFSDRAWLFLSDMELRDGSRTVSRIEASKDVFWQVGDRSWRVRFSGFAIQVAKGKRKTISVRVKAKDDLFLTEPREIVVSIPADSVRGRDEIGVLHSGPDAQEAEKFSKSFFVKRKEIKP